MIEETKEAEKGVEFLLLTRKNWQDCLLGHHITWHLALYYFGTSICFYGYISVHLSIHPCFSLSIQFSINLLTDLNNTDKILEEFDSVTAPCMDSKNLFQLLDASSLLWRLNVRLKRSDLYTLY